MELENNISYEDFKSICRFCLKQDLMLNEIFKCESNDDIQHQQANDDDGDHSNNNIVSMVLSCIGLKINLSDGLPEFLCTQCLTNLTTLNVFKNQCISSDVYLKTIKLKNEQNYCSNSLMVASTSKNNRIMRPRKVIRTNISPISPIKSESSSINNDPDYINDSIQMEIFDTHLSEQYLNQNEEEENVEEKKCAFVDSEKQSELIPKIKRHRKKKLPLPMNDIEHQISISNKDEQQTAAIPKPKRKRIRTKKYKNKPRPPEICPICGKMQSALRQHMTTHSAEKRYECEFCDKRFRQRESLKDHLNFHTGVKPYKCDACDKAFIRPSALRTHKRTHTDERRYACHLCTKKYRYSNSLKQHVRGHTEDRRYKCDQCSKMFLTRCVLNKHFLIHTGVREFQCELCPKAFQTKWNLTVHGKVHGGGHKRGNVNYDNGAATTPLE